MVYVKKYTISERRSGQERRKSQKRWHKFLLFGGNRQMVRRVNDRRRINLLDRYKPTLLFSFMTVLCLSLIDGTLTLILVEQGAQELNPVMRYYLAHGPATFLMTKYGVTALALFVLVVLHNNIVSGHRIGFLLPFCKLTFRSVVIWEIFLLYR